MHIKHGFDIIYALVHCLVIASYLRSQNDCILPGLGQHEVQPLTRTVRANLQNSGLIVVRNPKWQPSLASCRLSF
uniref:Secreted protein n=1 Tax=Salix viminalis TaxID=40686 RepID=A0A6N2N4N9_SALVM